MIGVSHDMPTFEAHKETFREVIRASPFVFLEYFGPTMQERALPTTTDQELQAYQDDRESMFNFFVGIGKLCAEEGKDIVVVNPQTIDSEYMESYLTAGVAAGASLELAIELFTKVALKQRLDRRSFLRLGLFTPPAAVGVFGHLGYAQEIRKTLEAQGVLSSDLPEAEKAEIFSWYMQDWRDVRAASGYEKAIEKYAEEIPDTQPIFAINGKMHNTTVEYIKRPVLRAMKALTYPHYEMGGKSEVRRIHYDKESNSWSVVDRVDY